MGFTRFGDGIWSWEPWLSLEARDYDDYVGRGARMLWLALYTSPESKRTLPGLWHGSIATMADASGMSPDSVLASLTRLIERRMVENDQRLRVLRLTRLPDAGESPANGNAIRGWWKRFNSVPQCAVRDAHVPLIRWLMDEWCRVSRKVLSQDHAKAWSETFGTMQIPESVIRAGQLLIESDTSTPAQTSLFSASSGASGYPPTQDGYLETHRDRDPKEIRDSGTVRVTVPVTPAEPFGYLREKDLGSGSGSLSSSSSGIGDDQPPSSGASGQGGSGGKPHLTLVPLAAFDADDLAEMLAAVTGRFPRALTREVREQLQRAIGASGDIARGDGVLAVLREYVAHAPKSLEGISPEMVSAPGWLPTTIQQAHTWKAEVDAKRAMLAAARTEAGV